MPSPRQVLLALCLNPIEHLEFEFLLPNLFRGGPNNDSIGQLSIVRCQRGANAIPARLFAEEFFRQSKIVLIDISLVWKRDGGRLRVGALHESDGGSSRSQRIHIIAFRASEDRLEHRLASGSVERPAFFQSGCMMQPYIGCLNLV